MKFSTIFFISMFLSPAVTAAPEVRDEVHSVDICYKPIYDKSKVPSTVESFPKTCVPLGRFTEGESRHRLLGMALLKMNAAFKRVEKPRKIPNALALKDVKVRILAPDMTIFINSRGEGIVNDKKFILNASELLEVERVLGGAFECIKHNEEKLRRQKTPSA
ncbi:hypothetical protein INH39_11920 [Massilia violaceinigra]|uniref:Uncharacterized protein n=1 Tax=Massilia violaceinigra TaxID=2045208 RepID=A0ABY4AFJ1_9BURK|nr:hypothetical protein [Massilia violaceinigra]UOD32306.1 hypothetical protein INH39_11920 [Massilia violaceinigra]